MEKNYVYKVRANGMVYDNLASAIEDCVKSIQSYVVHHRTSKPIVAKVDGGYQVIITDIHGNIYKRGIDIFVPKHLVDKVDYYIDELRETSACSCEDEDDDDYEDDDDDNDMYCDNCGADFSCDELVDIDHQFMCKNCALDYINAYKNEDDILCEENTICEHCGKVIEKIENYFFVDDCDLCRECAKEYIEEQY